MELSSINDDHRKRRRTTLSGISPSHKSWGPSQTNSLTYTATLDERDRLPVDQDEDEPDYDSVPRFVKLYWYNYKLVMITFNSLLLMLCAVCCLGFTFLYIKGEEPYLNRSDAMKKRNFSVLVPIWGALGNNSLGDWSDHFYIILLATGLLYGCLGTLGVFTFRSSCYYTEDTSYKFHKYYVILNLVTLVFILTNFTSLLFGGGHEHTYALRALMNKLQDEYEIMGENSFTQAMNILMIVGDCCGIYGPEDFSEINMTVVVDKSKNPYKFAPKLLYWPKEREVLRLRIPPVCCKAETFAGDTLEKQYENMKECARMNFSTRRSNIAGCGAAFITRYFADYGTVVWVLGCVFLTLQMYVACVCVCRALQHLDITDQWRDESEDTEELPEALPVYSEGLEQKVNKANVSDAPDPSDSEETGIKDAKDS